MEDTIYRQQAIDALAIGEELLKRVLDDADVVGVEREKYEWGLGLIESCISDMKELSSAQPDVPDINVGDMVYRQDAIDAIGEKPFAGTADEYDYEQGLQNQWERDVVAIKILPPAQPERMCHGCRHEKHGSVVCDSCSRFFLDRYEVDNNG